MLRRKPVSRAEDPAYMGLAYDDYDYGDALVTETPEQSERISLWKRFGQSRRAEAIMEGIAGLATLAVSGELIADNAPIDGTVMTLPGLLLGYVAARSLVRINQFEKQKEAAANAPAPVVHSLSFPEVDQPDLALVRLEPGQEPQIVHFLSDGFGPTPQE